MTSKVMDQAEKARQNRVRDVEELEKKGRSQMAPTPAPPKTKNSKDIQELVAASIN
jgi:hypothetical protein